MIMDAGRSGLYNKAVSSQTHKLLFLLQFKTHLLCEEQESDVENECGKNIRSLLHSRRLQKFPENPIGQVG